MPRLKTIPLMGVNAKDSMSFLNTHGFYNCSSISDIYSIWYGNNISICIDPNDTVLTLKKLFEIIYDSGFKHGSLK